MRQRTVIGDFGCLGVNIAAWQAANRVPLFPDQTNRWILLRTLRDGADDAEIRNNVQAVMAKWIGDVPTGWRPVGERAEHVRIGPADNVTVKRIASERWSFDRTARGREDLTYPPIPFLVAGPWTSVEVTFDWRSRVESLPWPVWHGGPVATTAGRVCPIDADWILDEAGNPLGPSPAEVPWGEQLERIVKEEAEEVAEAIEAAAERGVGAIAVPLVVAGVFLGLVYLMVREIT